MKMFVPASGSRCTTPLFPWRGAARPPAAHLRRAHFDRLGGAGIAPAQQGGCSASRPSSRLASRGTACRPWLPTSKIVRRFGDGLSIPRRGARPSCSKRCKPFLNRLSVIAVRNLDRHIANEAGRVSAGRDTPRPMPPSPRRPGDSIGARAFRRGLKVAMGGYVSQRQRVPKRVAPKEGRPRVSTPDAARAARRRPRGD